MSKRGFHGRRAASCIAALSILGLLLSAGCGTALDGLLPNASSLSSEVRAACAGVITEQEMVTSMLAARIDRSNGYTKDEELFNVTTNCALDAVFSGISAADCVACKSAILDQVYGD